MAGTRARRRVAGLLAAGLLGALVAGPPAAADDGPPPDLYVNSEVSCSDTGAGTQALPLCGVQAAADRVVPGQTVRVMHGLHDGDVTITHSGTPDAPITFEADFPHSAPSGGEFVLRGNPLSTAATLTLSGVHDVRLVGLGVQHVTGDGIDITGSHDIALDAVLTHYLAATTPLSYRVDGLRVDGGSSGITVTRSEFLNSERELGSPLHIEPGAKDVVLSSDVVMPNRASTAPAVDADAAVALTLTNTTVSAPKCGTGIALGGTTSATLENNVVWTPAVATAPGTTDPLTCAPPPLLTVAAAATGTVTADWNAFASAVPRADHAWGGTEYPTAADLAAAVPGQAAHGLDTTVSEVAPDHMTGADATAPPEGSPLIDSGDANAAHLTATDFLGHPRTNQDPVVADTGAGPGPVDRGAYERHSVVTLAPAYTPDRDAAPVPLAVTVTAHAADTWGEALTGQVDFGDGSAPVPLAAGTAGGTAAHVYTTPGRYSQTLTVTDTDGMRATSTRYMTAATVAVPAVTLHATRPVSAVPPGPQNVVPETAVFTVSAGAGAWELSGGRVSFGDGVQEGLPLSGSVRHTYPKAGTYTVNFRADDVLGRASTTSISVSVGDAYLPAGPDHRYDSRGSGPAYDTVKAHATVRLPLADLGGGGDEGRGVQVTVTVTDTKASGFLTVYPDGTTRPTVSTLNFTAGATVSNSLMVIPGADGVVDFYNGSGGPVDLTVDSYGVLYGEGPDGGPSADTFTPVSPWRALDTRVGNGAPRSPLAPGGQLTVAVGGRDGIPADATGAVVNLTATNTESAGWASVYPPVASAVRTAAASHWAAGGTNAGLVVVPLDHGAFGLLNHGSGNADFIADVVGYYSDGGTGSLEVPTPPVRVLDTRTGAGTGGRIARLGANQSLVLHIAGHNQVPATGVTAVRLNVTVTDDAAGGYIAAYPDGIARPNASTLNFGPGQVVANAAIEPLGADGAIRLYNHSNAPVDLVIDQTGFFCL